MNAPTRTTGPAGPWAWMSWADLVCKVAEDAAEVLDPADVDHLLWEHTAWPMDSAAGVYRRLVELLHNGTMLGRRPCGCTPTGPEAS